MVRQLSAVLFSLFLSLGMVTSVEAQPGGGHRGGGHGPGPGGPEAALLNPQVLDRVADELKLDEATHQKLEDLAYKTQKDLTRMRAELDLARLDLKRQLDQDNPNQKAVLAQVESMGRLETELRKLQVGALLEMRSLLTPEQRKALQELHERRQAERREMREERGGRGMGGPGMGGPGMGGPGMGGPGMGGPDAPSDGEL